MGRYQVMAEYQRNERMQGQNWNMNVSSEGEVNTIDSAELENCIVRPIRLTYEDLSAFATVKNSIQIVLEENGSDKDSERTSKPADAAEQFPGKAKDADLSAAKAEPKEQGALQDEAIRDAIIVFYENAVKRMSKREALQAAREAAEKYLNTLQEFVDAAEPAEETDGTAAPSAETEAAPEPAPEIESDSVSEAPPVSDAAFEPAGFGETEYLGGSSSFGETEYLGGPSNFGSTDYPGGPSNFGETEYLGGPSTFGETEYLGGPSSLGGTDYPGGPSSLGGTDYPGGLSNYEKTEYLGGSADLEKTEYPGEPIEIEKTEYLGGSAGYGEMEDNHQS